MLDYFWSATFDWSKGSATQVISRSRPPQEDRASRFCLESSTLVSLPRRFHSRSFSSHRIMEAQLVYRPRVSAYPDADFNRSGEQEDEEDQFVDDTVTLIQTLLRLNFN